LLFGPENTDTLNGFLDLVLARGLRVNLFYYGWPDQPARLTVFWSLLRLQAALPVVGLMAVGLVGLAFSRWRLALLLGLSTVLNIAFIINTIQDVMAYLMVPFMLLMMLAGAGILTLLHALDNVNPRYRDALQAAVAVVLLALPVMRGVQLAPRVSLAQFDDTRQWVSEVYTHFDGQGEGAYLLAHWEHLTPLWYEQFTGNTLPPEDVIFVFVAANSPTPWLDNTQALFEQGPIYVSGYQPELIRAGYRLRPAGPQMYQVVEAGNTEEPSTNTALDQSAGPVTLVGVTWGDTTAQPGERVPLSLAMRVEEPVTDLYFPYVRMGEVVFDFTTDSHVASPNWLPGEVIVERYDMRVPFGMPPGEYPVELVMRNLTQGEAVPFTSGQSAVEIGRVTVTPPTSEPVPYTDLLADIGHQVGLVNVRVSGGGETRSGLWEAPMQVGPHDRLTVQLQWRALTPPDENWKVFLHLTDEVGRVLAQVDTPPLGGAFPTYLWFPKWVPGQQVTDPYTLTVPADIPAGRYRLQVGLYGFNTLQRAGVYSLEGDLIGDRVILGGLEVVP
jgi:hypothetical protein